MATVVRHRTLLLGALFAGPCAFAAPEAATLAELDRLGRSIAAQKCQRPLEVKTSFVRNPRFAEISDEMVSIACRGLRIAIYRSNSTPPRELPMSVVLEDVHPRLPATLSIGASGRSVRATLGPPSTTPGQNLEYPLGAGKASRDTVTFEIQAGRVQAISWLWEVD